MLSSDPESDALAARQPQDQVWPAVLAALAKKLSPQCLETWFRPAAITACNETTCELTVPNDTFRQAILENYSGVLTAALVDVFGTPRQLKISIREDERTAGGPHPLPVVRASELEAREGAQWLIEKLWLAEGVGVIGGPPRAYKSLLALDMAVSVASGSPCLGVFPVHARGPVLLYAAEDSSSVLRLRLQSLARNRRIDLRALDVHVITAERLRLDQNIYQERLEATVSLHQPKLLILDPLVRIHSADENASNAMAALLGYFRALQRAMGVAVALIHHSRKRLTLGPGYNLRGSSDLYAWTDCLLSIERHGERRSLLAEHRSAPGLGPLALELLSPEDANDAPCLRLLSVPEDAAPGQKEDPPEARILQLLAGSPGPLTAERIRLTLRMRKQRVLGMLRSLSEQGKIRRSADGYVLGDPGVYGSRFRPMGELPGTAIRNRLD
jgi:hypothetical protein